ncbi:MAG: hypothetical protein WA208_18790 [Thermoanaerobaculia bacterium]
MKRTILALLALLAVLSPIALQAQTGTWGMRGISRDFASAGEIVFAADGRGIASYDVSGSPVRRIDVEVSEFETRELVLVSGEAFVASSGGILRYLTTEAGDLASAGIIRDAAGFEHVAADAQWIAASNGQTLRFWRRSVHDEPLEVADTRLTAGVEALLFVDGRLYAAVRDVAIYVFEPATGQRVAELPLAARDLAGSGTVLWAAAGGNGIAAIDIANPLQPTLLAVESRVERAVDGIAVAGTRVYARSRPGLVTVFDGSNPRVPRAVATVSEPVTAIAATADKLFVSGSIIDSDGLANETGRPIRVFDAQTLAFRADFVDYAGPVSGVATDGSLAWVVDPPFFRVLDVSSTAMPRELASIRVEDIQDSVRVKNGLAIIYGRGRVNLIDVTNPYGPKHVGTYHSTGHPPSNAAIARDTIVEANEHSGLHVVDYSNPAAPVQIAGRMWHYSDLTASDDVIYALVTDHTMLVADLSNRRQVTPTWVGVHDATQIEIAPEASARPEFLVTRSSTGFQIFSLENPLQPAPVRFAVVDRPGMMGTGESAVHFEQGGELWSIDLRTPADPSRAGLRLHSAMRIASAAGKVVVADRYSVRILGPDTARPRPQSSSRRRAVRP